MTEAKNCIGYPSLITLIWPCMNLKFTLKTVGLPVENVRVSCLTLNGIFEIDHKDNMASGQSKKSKAH